MKELGINKNQSANVHRRNISTGQRAMAVAMLSPELAAAVMRGEKPLQAALTEARFSQGNAT